MQADNSFQELIFKAAASEIESLALKIFKYQAVENPIYRQYLFNLGCNVASVQTADQIPYLPISFFKDAPIKSGNWKEEKLFESSGTTQQTVKSLHFVKELAYYDRVCFQIFERVYGSITNYHILGLLPSYLEREGSSLVHMVDMLVKKSDSPYSGFYLYNYDNLKERLLELEGLNDGKKILLIGVTFALLDFAEAYPMNLEDVIVMETGGMKGRKEEMTRAQVHDILKSRLSLKSIHSEYGMTELLSQAYSSGDGKYYTPDWMKISTRDNNDPFADSGKRPGIIKVMDLANIHTCSFIETQDIGQLNDDGSFEVLGRADNSEMRGCSLMTL